MSYVVVLAHRFFCDAKTFKMPTKLYADSMDTVMGLNEIDQGPEGINKKSDLNDDQDAKEISQISM